MPRTDNAVKTHRACLTLDNKTLGIIDLLRLRTRTTRSDIVRTILESAQRGEISFTELEKFSRQEWASMVTRHDKKVVVRFDWPVELDDVLRLLSLQLFDHDNKSETFRLLVTFYGLREEAARLVPCKVYDLELQFPVPKAD